MADDPYRTLELDCHATVDEIRHAYFRLAQKYHPDHNGDDPHCIARFKQVQRAYELLSAGEYVCQPPKRKAPAPGRRSKASWPWRWLVATTAMAVVVSLGSVAGWRSATQRAAIAARTAANESVLPKSREHAAALASPSSVPAVVKPSQSNAEEPTSADTSRVDNAERQDEEDLSDEPPRKAVRPTGKGESMLDGLLSLPPVDHLALDDFEVTTRTDQLVTPASAEEFVAPSTAKLIDEFSGEWVVEVPPATSARGSSSERDRSIVIPEEWSTPMADTRAVTKSPKRMGIMLEPPVDLSQAKSLSPSTPPKIEISNPTARNTAIKSLEPALNTIRSVTISPELPRRALPRRTPDIAAPSPWSPGDWQTVGTWKTHQVRRWMPGPEVVGTPSISPLPVTSLPGLADSNIRFRNALPRDFTAPDIANPSFAKRPTSIAIPTTDSQITAPRYNRPTWRRNTTRSFDLHAPAGEIRFEQLSPSELKMSGGAEGLR